MKRVILSAVAVLMIAGTVCAQQAPQTAAGDYLFDNNSYIRLKRGDLTWSGAATMTAPMGDADGTFNFLAAVGYFVTDYVEIEGTLTWVDVGDASGSAIGVGANRYFREYLDNVYPYIGGGLQQWFGDDYDATELYAKVGVRQYLSAHLGLRYWLQISGDASELDESVLTAYVGIFAHPY